MPHRQAPDPWAHIKPRRRKLPLDFGEAPESLGSILQRVASKLADDPGALAVLLPEEGDLR